MDVMRREDNITCGFYGMQLEYLFNMMVTYRKCYWNAKISCRYLTQGGSN